MKVTYLAAAIAALSSTAALAAPAAAIDPTNASFVAPDAAHTIYVAGASAQQNPLETILKTAGKVFDNIANVTKITGTHGEFAYLGYAQADSKPLVVVYNGTNGSAAGLNQLLSNGTGEAESLVVKLTNGATNGCGTLTSGSPNTVTCTQAGYLEATMALSDVYAGEFGSSGSLCDGPLHPYASPICINTSYLTLSDIKSPLTSGSGTTGLEGFGVIVNDTAYNALLARNVAEGILPASCSSATVTRGVANPATAGACQPSIRSGDYANLATKSAGWGSSAIDNDFVTYTPTQIHRRDEFSGSQAASNIFFLNNVCGKKGYFGARTPARATDGDANVGPLTFVEQPGTGNVESGVAAAPAGTYALGVVSSNRADHADSSAKNWWFVKIDQVSPNYKPDGTLDTTKRVNMLNGSYTFAVEMAAYVRNSISGVPATVTTAIADGLADSTVTPAGLNGIGYLDAPLSWPDGVQSKFSHGGNNCAPLH